MEKIKQAIADFLRESGIESKFKENSYLEIWPQVAGSQILKHASPVSLKEKKLWVEVTDNVWIYHLTMLKPKLIREFNKTAGFEAIDDITFLNVDFPSSRRKFDYHKGIKDKRISNTVPNLNFKVDLSHEEKEVLQKTAENSPPHYREHLRKMLRGSLLRQKRRRESGAVDCYLCGFPYFREELKGELCLLCLQKFEHWKKTLRPLFYRTPWVKLDQLQSIYPSLEPKIFNICQEKIKQKYYKRISKVSKRETLKKGVKKKILLRLIQRFVMLSEKKDPARLKEEDMLKAIQFFPEFGRILDICFSRDTADQ